MFRTVLHKENAKKDRFITGKISYDVRTYPETYLKHCQISKMERFAKIVNGF